MRRVSWTAADQVASSLTNLALTYAALRATDLEGFGAFSLAFGVYLLVLAVSRAVASEPLVVFHAADEPSARRAGAASLGVAVAAGVLAAAGLAVAAVVLPPRLAPAFAAMAVVIVGLLLQDALRFVFIASARPALAFANDVLWGVVGIVALVAVARVSDSTTFAILAWGAGAAVACGVGLAQAGTLPDIVGGVRFVHAHRDAAWRFVTEALLERGSATVAIVAVGALGGLAALGALDTARLLLQPVLVIVIAVRAFAVAELGRAARRGPARLRRAVTALVGVLTALTGVWTLLLLALPAGLGQRLVSDEWSAARGLLVLVGLQVALRGAAEAWRAGLRARHDVRTGLRARLVQAPTFVAGAAAGAAWAGARGAAWGMVAASLLGAGLLGAAFHLRVRDATPAPVRRVRLRYRPGAFVGAVLVGVVGGVGVSVGGPGVALVLALLTLGAALLAGPVGQALTDAREQTARTITGWGLAIMWASFAFTGLRLGGFLEPADVVLALVVVPALLLLRPDRRTHPPGVIASSPFVLGYLLIASGSLIALWNTAHLAQATANLVRLAVSALVTLVVTMRFDPDEHETGRLFGAWFLGTTVSAAAGIVAIQQVGRARGFTTHPNELALLAVMALPLGARLWATARRRSTRPLLALGFVILGWGLLASGSRAGLLGAAVVSAFLLARATGSVGRAVTFTGAAALAVVLVVGPSGVAGENAFARLGGSASATGSDTSRRAFLEAGIEQITRSPVVGTGLTFDNLRYHNLVVQYWAAAGLLGLVGVVMVLGSGAAPAVRSLASPRRIRSLDTRARDLWYASVGFVGYATIVMFQLRTWPRNVMGFIALVGALSLGERQARRRATGPGQRVRSQRLAGNSPRLAAAIPRSNGRGS